MNKSIVVMFVLRLLLLKFLTGRGRSADRDLEERLEAVCERSRNVFFEYHTTICYISEDKVIQLEKPELNESTAHEVFLSFKASSVECAVNKSASNKLCNVKFGKNDYVAFYNDYTDNIQFYTAVQSDVQFVIKIEGIDGEVDQKVNFNETLFERDILPNYLVLFIKENDGESQKLKEALVFQAHRQHDDFNRNRFQLLSDSDEEENELPQVNGEDVTESDEIERNVVFSPVELNYSYCNEISYEYEKLSNIEVCRLAASDSIILGGNVGAVNEKTESVFWFFKRGSFTCSTSAFEENRVNCLAKFEPDNYLMFYEENSNRIRIYTSLTAQVDVVSEIKTLRGRTDAAATFEEISSDGDRRVIYVALSEKPSFGQHAADVNLQEITTFEFTHGDNSTSIKRFKMFVSPPMSHLDDFFSISGIDVTRATLSAKPLIVVEGNEGVTSVFNQSGTFCGDKLQHIKHDDVEICRLPSSARILWKQSAETEDKQEERRVYYFSKRSLKCQPSTSSSSQPICSATIAANDYLYFYEKETNMLRLYMSQDGHFSFASTIGGIDGDVDQTVSLKDFYVQGRGELKDVVLFDIGDEVVFHNRNPYKTATVIKVKEDAENVVGNRFELTFVDQSNTSADGE